MSFISLQFFGALTTGLAAGVIAGLFGVGGGILIVPALLFLFHLDGINPVISMQLAVGTSLTTIIITNLSATWNHHKYKSVHWLLVKQYTPGIIIGAWLGAHLAASMNGHTLRTLFGLFELIVGLSMVFNIKPNQTEKKIHSANLNSFIGLIVGVLSTLFGIGGGTLMVPFLTMLSGLNIRQAVGSSSAIGAALAMVGATGFIQSGWGNSALPGNAMGFVVPVSCLGIILGTLITTPMGVRLAHSVEPLILKKGFGFFLLLVGIKLLWN